MGTSELNKSIFGGRRVVGMFPQTQEQALEKVDADRSEAARRAWETRGKKEGTPVAPLEPKRSKQGYVIIAESEVRNLQTNIWELGGKRTRRERDEYTTTIADQAGRAAQAAHDAGFPEAERHFRSIAADAREFRFRNIVTMRNSLNSAVRALREGK